MSARYIGNKLFKHGTALLRQICKREAHSTTIANKVGASSQASSPPTQLQKQIVSKNYVLRNVGIQITQQARKLLVENAQKITNTFAADVRRRATQRILYGTSGPVLGLVGIAFASGTSILSKEEELEGVCWEIRECMSKVQWFFEDPKLRCEASLDDKVVTLNTFTFGKPIAKGANAAVYAAKIKSQKQVAANGHEDYPFAIKMMFNYDIQSNAIAILRGMYKETVPARMYYNSHGISDWEYEFLDRSRHLPPHPNIVNILTVFTDFVPELDECRELYPAALPKRIDPEGEGRNMSLFLLMKRYHQSLQEFTESTSLSTRTSILLLTQLLEGVSHMVSHNIAHRDLKSDNVLLDLSDPDSPLLVITDFGCCLSEKNHNLVVPYRNYDVDKGGNAALMAPEIICQKPGTFSVLNYTKSDLWAVGALAYEIFGAPNPFYVKGNLRLRNTNYEESALPDLPGNVPIAIKILIKNLLKRDPRDRLDAEMAATVCQLFLWAPSSWLNQQGKPPTSEEILDWLLSVTAKVLCEGRACVSSETRLGKSGHAGYAEYLLISSFLCRARLSIIKSALDWIYEHTRQDS
ncbi:serine/threonine-protein kinase Pink1, mitochondrial [Cylas formicarius]|uniref:serine/threonine-protein kinase Pink1, mitochondrial n=1 Tax=Cylas formicarius TaxID=197179 RepID=UPI002958D2AF|nr:serine/threonine-protein kinase Pink1, mitochondrial [Cylas formicarius]